MASFHTLSALMALLLAVFTLQTSALLFQVDSLTCTELDYSVSITPIEWKQASYLELFFISTQGGQNYSTPLSLNPAGDFPTDGNYNKVFTFGNTQLSGDFRIGVGLANVNGQILYTSTNVPMTIVDTRTFHFGGCGNTGVVGVLTSSSSTPVSTTSAASSGFATSFTAAPTASSSAAQSSSPSATPTGTLNSSSSATIQPAHKSTNPGAIAGGVVAGLILLLIAGVLARWYSSRRRTKALDGAAHRMDSIRSPSPEEKDFGTNTNDGPLSPETQHRALPQGYYSQRDVNAASAYGAPSMGSHFQSDAYPIPSYPQSEAHSYHDAHAYAPAPASVQGGNSDDIRVVHMPFSLTPGQTTATMPESRSQASLNDDPFAESALPYLPSSSTAARSRNNFFDAATSEQHSVPVQKRVPPPALDTTITEGATPAPTTPKSGSPSSSDHERKPSSFKIPRVNVPTYLATQELESLASDNTFAQPMSRASSTKRRGSTGATTFVSVEENPFVDAESMPELPQLEAKEAEKVQAKEEEEGDLTPMQDDVAAALQYAEALLEHAEQQSSVQHGRISTAGPAAADDAAEKHH